MGLFSRIRRIFKKKAPTSTATIGGKTFTQAKKAAGGSIPKATGTATIAGKTYTQATSGGGGSSGGGGGSTPTVTITPTAPKGQVVEVRSKTGELEERRFHDETGARVFDEADPQEREGRVSSFTIKRTREGVTTGLTEQRSTGAEPLSFEAEEPRENFFLRQLSPEGREIFDIVKEFKERPEQQLTIPAKEKGGEREEVRAFVERKRETASPLGKFALGFIPKDIVDVGISVGLLFTPLPKGSKQTKVFFKGVNQELVAGAERGVLATNVDIIARTGFKATRSGKAAALTLFEKQGKIVTSRTIGIGATTQKALTGGRIKLVKPEAFIGIQGAKSVGKGNIGSQFGAAFIGTSGKKAGKFGNIAEMFSEKELSAIASITGSKGKVVAGSLGEIMKIKPPLMKSPPRSLFAPIKGKPGKVISESLGGLSQKQLQEQGFASLKAISEGGLNLAPQQTSLNILGRTTGIAISKRATIGKTQAPTQKLELQTKTTFLESSKMDQALSQGLGQLSVQGSRAKQRSSSKSKQALKTEVIQTQLPKQDTSQRTKQIQALSLKQVAFPRSAVPFFNVSPRVKGKFILPIALPLFGQGGRSKPVAGTRKFVKTPDFGTTLKTDFKPPRIELGSLLKDVFPLKKKKMRIKI